MHIRYTPTFHITYSQYTAQHVGRKQQQQIRQQQITLSQTRQINMGGIRQQRDQRENTDSSVSENCVTEKKEEQKKNATKI